MDELDELDMVDALPVLLYHATNGINGWFGRLREGFDSFRESIQSNGDANGEQMKINLTRRERKAFFGQESVSP